MSTVLSIIAALLILSLFVVIHELGHYGAGKLLGFKIVEFAVGMGPRIFKKEKNGTIFALRAIPMGGMCQFYGEDQEVGDGLGFGSHKVWKRIIVIAAGPFMNILAALLLAVVLLSAYGDIAPQISEFSGENTPAEIAGILPGDIIIAVDGRELAYASEAVSLIVAADGNEAVITVKRGNELVDVTVREFFNAEVGYNLIGVTIGYARVEYTFFEAIGGSVKYVWNIMRQMFSFLGSIFTQGVQPGEVAGPVGTISLIGQAVRYGLETVVQMAILISVNLGIINLLPLPALDGGRLVFLAVEGIRGKPISPDKEGIVHFIGLILLFGLIIYLTVMDVGNLIGG